MIKQAHSASKSRQLFYGIRKALIDFMERINTDTYCEILQKFKQTI